jgi:hypothetical protein
MSRKLITHDEFVHKANQVHHYGYQYSSPYLGSRTKLIIICNTCNRSFEQYPYSHLSGTGCKFCDIVRRKIKNTKTHEQFINKANYVHQSKYQYPNRYNHSQIHINIVCPIHGIFNQLPYVHLLGGGCPTYANAARSGGYTEQYFINNPDNKHVPGWLYVISIDINNTTFIKIGIATNLNRRLYYYTNIGMLFQIITTIQMSIYDAFCAEQQLIKQLKRFRFFPNIKFDGYTECFVPGIPILDELKPYQNH